MQDNTITKEEGGKLGCDCGETRRENEMLA